MDQYGNKGVLERLIFPSKTSRIYVAIMLGAMVPLVYLLVYFTGGIKFVYSHTMYIPIVLIGVIFGWRAGGVTALVGAILLGPLMPIDVLTGEQQAPLNWIYRALIFISIGLVSGYFSDSLRRSQNQVIKLLSHHPQTKVPLYNAIPKEDLPTFKNHNVFAIRILNYQHIIDFIGVSVYHRLWSQIYDTILESDTLQGSLFQIETRVFVYATTCEDCQTTKDELKELLYASHLIEDVPIYLDIALGYCSYLDSLKDTVESAIIASRHAQLHHQSYMQFDEIQKPDKLAFSLVAEMKNALLNHELFLEFQPIYDSKTKLISSAEALIRWQHPKHGLLPPDRFIPMIEQTHLINDLTTFVCSEVKDKLSQVIEKYDIKISINISTNNFFNKQFVSLCTDSNLFTQTEREHLTFEITESILMENPEKSRDILYKIKNTGISLSLDDFGTGYSSLSYLSGYPLDVVKIDKSFIKRLSEKSVESIVKTAIDLSHKLDYKVIGEGVETEHLGNRLAVLGCDYLQGFYYSKPLPFKAFMIVLQSTNT